MTADRALRLAGSPLYCVATFTRSGVERLLPRVAAAAAAGVGVVQLRVKDESTSARCELLARLRALLPAATLLLVNDDLQAVFSANGEPLADGLHLGREDAAALAPIGTPPGERIAAGLAAARERLGPELLLGTSTRTLAELRAALAAGADHAGFGAMAASATKRDTVLADPAELARCVAALPDVPLFPIGGLEPGNLGLVLDAGCHRAALGAAILDAPDPARVVERCLALLRGDRPLR